jgi:hypothetical protein
MANNTRVPKATGDDDTEGHGVSRMPKATGDDDTEGHGVSRMPKATGDDDTEGHRFQPRAAGEDDTEGHGKVRLPKASGDDEGDDAEGHSMLSNPTIARELASAREQEIRRHLRDRSALIGQGERPNKRKG